MRGKFIFKINSRDLEMKSEVNVTVANPQSIASLQYLICAPLPLFATKPGLKLHQPVNCEKSDHSPVKAWDINLQWNGLCWIGGVDIKLISRGFIAVIN